MTITLYANDIKTFFEEVETRSLGGFMRDMFETSAGYSMPEISLLEIKYLLETVAMLLKNAKANPEAGIKIEVAPSNDGDRIVLMLCSEDKEGKSHISYTGLYSWIEMKLCEDKSGVLYKNYEDDLSIKEEHPSKVMGVYTDKTGPMDSSHLDIKTAVLFYNAEKNKRTDIVSEYDHEELNKCPVFFLSEKDFYSEYIKASVSGENGIHLIKKINGLTSGEKKQAGFISEKDEQKTILGNPAIKRKYEKLAKDAMGDAAWKKIDDECKSWLLSALFGFHNMKDVDKDLDFSGVVLQICKVFELFVKKRLFLGYLTFLESRFPDNLLVNLPTYMKIAQQGVEMPIQSGYFTLGIMPFIMGMNSKGVIQNERDYDLFKTYMLKRQLRQDYAGDIDEILQEIVSVSEYIRKNYRNQSAHSVTVDMGLATDCLDFCIAKENKIGRLVELFREEDETEPSELREFTVEDSSGIRLDKWLPENNPGYSRSSIREMIESKAVTVNGQEANCNYKVQMGDKIEISRERKLRKIDINKKDKGIGLNIRIITVRALLDEKFYELIRKEKERLSAFCDLDYIEVKFDLYSESTSAEAIERAKSKEGERIKRYLQCEKAFTVLVTSAGEKISTKELSEFVERIQTDEKTECINFIIGGSFGVCEEIKDAADDIIDFSEEDSEPKPEQYVLLKRLNKVFAGINGITF